MSSQKQTLKIKCPHCGWVRTMTINVQAGQTEVVAGPRDWVRGASEAIRAAVEKFKTMLDDPELKAANAWLPMPACPNVDCGKTYEYNIHTRETR